MQAPSVPSNESQRQQEVEMLSLASPELEECFNRVTRLLAGLLEVPITAFSIIDKDRQFFKASQGLDVRETPRDISFCGHTILEGDILVIDSAPDHPVFHDNPLVTGEPHIRFYAGIPVRGPSGQVVGSLCAIDTHAREMTTSMRANLEDLRGLLEDELLLRSLINEDHLTGLLNKRCFQHTITEEWRRSARTLQPLALLTIDIDHFKAFNDTYGHMDGDECLAQLGATLKGACRRAPDRVFRTGGEEFSILLPNTGESHALVFANRLLETVDQLAITHSGAPDGHITVSIGLCSLEAASGEMADLEAFIEASDKALYLAKSRGRNRVVAKPFEIDPGTPANP